MWLKKLKNKTKLGTCWLGKVGLFPYKEKSEVLDADQVTCAE